MESHTVELDNASTATKMALSSGTEDHGPNINGNDSTTLSSHVTDPDVINANVSSDFNEDSREKNDLNNCALNKTDVHESVQQKLSVLCSNNDSISRHNESNASVNNSNSVNYSSRDVLNDLENDLGGESRSEKSFNNNKTTVDETKDDNGETNNDDKETKSDDNVLQSANDSKPVSENEETVLNEEGNETIQQDNTNDYSVVDEELTDNADVIVETSVLAEEEQPQNVSVTEKDENLNIDNNSSLSVPENNSSIANDKDDTIIEEDSHKSICDNSNISASLSRDQDNSNPPLSVDESSMNLSETGAGSGSEYERTEGTGFIQCDDVPEGDDVMDVIEVNAVDPFAQTIDGERNNDTLMDVDNSADCVNNRDVTTEDMDITEGMVQEMDVTKITEKKSNETEVNEKDVEEDMDVTNEEDDNVNKTIENEGMDVTKVCDKEIDAAETTEQVVTLESDVTQPIETNEESNTLKESETNEELKESEINKELDVSKQSETILEDSTTQETDVTKVPDKEMNKTKLIEQDMDMTEIADKSSTDDDDKKKSDSKDPSGNDSAGKSDEKADENETSKKTEEEEKKEDDSKTNDPNVTEVEESDIDKSKGKSKDGDSATVASSELKASTVVENDDEDVCIIPDTVPRVPSDPAAVSNFKSKLKSILSKSKTNIIEDSKTDESTSQVSSRPQRQAAKRADAQIKATVHQLEEDDGEKENDEDDAKADSKASVASPQPLTTQQMCQQCCKVRMCRYKILSQGKVLSYLCSEICTAKYKESLSEHILAARAKKNSEIVQDDRTKPSDGIVAAADKDVSSSSDTASVGDKTVDSVPDAEGLSAPSPAKRPHIRRVDENGEFIRCCSECGSTLQLDERNLSWETMDFCNEGCLGKYQTSLGSHCAYCKKGVLQSSLGKYCVRFGYDIRQFCCASCLEEFKKGLKVCSYCQKDISSSVEGFLAPVGDKGQFKDFCTQDCMEKYEQMSTNQRPPPQMHPCDVCKNNKLVHVEVLMDSKVSKLCSDVCFAAFKFVNTIKVDQCDMCHKYFDRANSATENYTVYYDDVQHNFCRKTCMNVYILAKRKIVPCNWCKVKKYNFDMIKRVTTDSQGAKQSLMMCSLNCLTLYQVSVNAVSSRRIKCDNCLSITQAQYHLTMSDATIRNFCNYNCVMKFQAQYNKSPITLPGGKSAAPIPTGTPKRVNQATNAAVDGGSGVPVISSVQSLAVSDTTAPVKQINSVPTVQISNSVSTVTSPVPVSLQTATTASLGTTPIVAPVLPISPMTSSTSPFHVIVKPSQPIKMVNKQVHCRPYMHTKGVSCRPHACIKQTQTDSSPEDDSRKVLIPVPVPIYIPAPMHMFTLPMPTPFPIPIPIPVPIFIPTTRGSAKGIMKEIKKIQEKMPADPFEAEMLMMAEMVAQEKKQEETSDSEDDAGDADAGPSASASGADDTSTAAADVTVTAGESGSSFNAGEVIEANSSAFGADDMLQMALKMATEMDDQSNSSPPVDLEAELTPTTITPAPPQTREMSSSASSRSNHTDGENEEDVDDPEPIVRESRGRKRLGRPPGSTNRRSSSGSTPAAKRPRKSSSLGRNATPVVEPPPPAVPVEKPDANMCLKYTFGVNAWKQWVTAKNAELEKLPVPSGNNRKVKLFKTDLLQLTADELNYSLCLFVKEARKPNGTSYAPDTIFYFCLGIQQYLFENSRIDNIFTDAYYEKFTDCLDEVAKVFSDVSDDSKLIVTRVEEEHLWESKQLGAHSPHVLLSTLMFFNTKHFNLTSVDEHMQLSFSHIMKHWKRNPSTPGSGSGSSSGKATPGSRNVLLRFYPPQSALDANSKKKKVYEQQENEENPLRCPVKLYEFYLSKCPESVKTRNDVFYLLPERSCVPDSPVWYSTMALGKEPLLKMLHRVKMVKEINIALRSS